LNMTVAHATPETGPHPTNAEPAMPNPKKPPLVSVIIRSMDRPTLSDAIESVSNQSYPNIEIVLVNAKGLNHTPVLDGSIAPRSVRYVDLGRPLARSAAANAGLDAARGDYLSFLDDDDLLLPEHIENLVRALEAAPAASAAYASTRVVSAGGEMIGRFAEPYSAPRLWTGNYLPIHAVLFRRAIVEKGCRFDETLETYEDWDFWLQASQNAEFLHVPAETAIYRAGIGNSGVGPSSAQLGADPREARLKLLEKWWPGFNASLYDEAIESLKSHRADLIRDLQSQLAAAEDANRSLQAALDRTENLARAHERRRSDLENELSRARQHIAELQAHSAALQSHLEAMRNSTSWRVTAPLRALGWPLARFRILRSTWNARYAAMGLQPPSLPILAFKALRTVVREGPAGLRLRVTALESESRSTSNFGPRVRAQAQPALPPLTPAIVEPYSRVFLDVFDTAILRPFRRPTDLFAYLAHQRGTPSFAQQRIAREAQARKDFAHQADVTLEQIYLDLPDADRTVELTAEIHHCVAHGALLARYKEWIEQGKQVYFVSDMYLDRKTIAAILERNGFTGYAGLFVSSEDQKTKGDGSRFEWLKQQIPGCETEAIHIGDHPISDFAQPKAHGFAAHRVPTAQEWFASDSFIGSKWDALRGETSLGLSSMLGLFRIWKCSLEHDQPPSYWRQFGFLYGGGLLVGFSEHLARELRQRSLDVAKLFFLARDGDIMSRVFARLHASPKAVYTYASRRCMSFPAIYDFSTDGDGEQLRLYTTPIGVASAQDILERFGYDDLDGLERDLVQLQASGEPWTDANILASLQKHREPLLKKAQAERQLLLEYLDSIGFFDRSQAVIVDVGWSGSIQNSLQKILDRERQSHPKVHGLYLGVDGHVPLKDAKTGYLFDGDRSAFAPYINLIELLTSSPEDSIVRIHRDEKSGALTAMRARQTEEEAQRHAVVRQIQQGIMEFTELAIRHFDGKLDFLVPRDFQVLYDALRSHASESDAQEIGALRHAMAVGNRFDQLVLTGI
jgi:predicted HAD superfamily hydrolase/glycosyltransferase involved in cell wall biosynthesis